MKAFLFFIFLTLPTYGVTLKVIGKSNATLFSEELSFEYPLTVGQASLNFLEKNQISYTGDDSGLAMINGLSSDMEIISDSELKAYGWCYRLNDIVPDAFANQILVTKQSDEIIWFYAYAHYVDGLWVKQCVPHDQ